MILAWLLHVVFSTAMAYVLASIFGGLNATISAISLALGLWMGVSHARRMGSGRPLLTPLYFSEGDAGVLEAVLGAFILFAAWRHFAWLLFPMDLHWATLTPHNFGDLPLHINFIRAFSNGIEFPPKNPIFATELLRYPYGIDLYNAMWESLGMRLQLHLMLVGMLGTLASVVFLRAFAGWWGIGAFFLNGGIAGWAILQGQPLSDIQAAIDWKNLFLTVFITQRGMLIALPLGLWLLFALREHVSGRRTLGAAELRRFGWAWGLLPLFHLHVFVVVSLMFAGIYCEYGGFKKGLRTFLTSSAFRWAFLPATWFVLFSTGFLQKAGVARWELGWMAKSAADLPWFLWLNFGPWLLVPPCIALLIHFSRERIDASERRRLWIEFGVYLGLFVLFFNLMLAPWAWDNIKLLIWPYLGFSRLLWVLLEPRFGRWLGPFERPLVALVLFFTGVVGILWTLQSPPGRAVPLYAISDLANAEGALEKVPAMAVFAAAPTHQHVLTYYGRLRTLGYEGHLWSHGIDATKVVEKQDRIMAGDPEFASLAREIGVTHIFWGPDERSRYGDKEREWMKLLPNVSRVPGFEIYEVK